MIDSWYKKCMPQVKDITPSFGDISSIIKAANNTSEIYVFGSVAANLNNPTARVKDLDILIKTDFLSDDLLAVNLESLKKHADISFLEDEGYNPDSVAFSHKLNDIKYKNLDLWVLSKDKKILHWGPIITSKTEHDEVKKDAEEHANKTLGSNFKSIKKSQINTWYDSYLGFFNKQLRSDPIGWYESEDINIKAFLDTCVRIDK